MTEIRRILRLAWDYPVRGESTYGLQPAFVNLSREQVRQGYEVHVIASVINGTPTEEYDNGVMIHRVGSPFGTSAFRKLSVLGAYCKDTVVHAHATSGLLPGVLKRLGRYRLAVQVHGVSLRSPTAAEFKLENLVRLIREKVAWGSADVVLSVCNFVSRDLADCYGIDPVLIKTVYNGVDENIFKALEREKPPDFLLGKKVVLYVGHFGTRKGVLDLIRAMKYIKPEIPEAHLLCIGGVPKWLRGTDYLRTLKHEIESNGVSDNVSLLEAIPNPDLVSFYSLAQVFALPSYYEAFPKVVLEAMSCSRPIIASNAGGIPEMVEEGKNGLLVKHGAVGDLANALSRLLMDEGEAQRMGRASRLKVEEMFTWKKVVERITAAYSGIGPVL